MAYKPKTAEERDAMVKELEEQLRIDTAAYCEYAANDVLTDFQDWLDRRALDRLERRIEKLKAMKFFN